MRFPVAAVAGNGLCDCDGCDEKLHSLGDDSSFGVVVAGTAGTVSRAMADDFLFFCFLFLFRLISDNLVASFSVSMAAAVVPVGVVLCGWDEDKGDDADADDWEDRRT